MHAIFIAASMGRLHEMACRCVAVSPTICSKSHASNVQKFQRQLSSNRSTLFVTFIFEQTGCIHNSRWAMSIHTICHYSNLKYGSMQSKDRKRLREGERERAMEKVGEREYSPESWWCMNTINKTNRTVIYDKISKSTAFHCTRRVTYMHTIFNSMRLQ